MSTGHDRPPVNMQRTHRQTDSWTDRQTNFRHRYYFVPHNICCKGVLKKAALLQVGSTQTQSEWLEGIEEKIQKSKLTHSPFPSVVCGSRSEEERKGYVSTQVIILYIQRALN